ncbi:MAG: pyridoxal 5'-phosphate synthase glutaminase subunit PdxT [Candidatus Methanolliviera hydrocarbonicum]|uniref:Pyridoxal 5'-phosphate synthase subunit PdxT n=1 Tax=Candidatus Methanolliviera hydrocarbonicum TaxID=2491085 RepID=A0A520KZ44_9EURY|nr:MAG: pyridoxal 5'-phosphate synthase glutaminase subunit PdxT [Candidatus Methanolliviera hydrocarbonicum]
MRLGVISIQGNVSEHIDAFRKVFDGEVMRVQNRGDARCCDGLVIPGGESTTIGKALEMKGMRDEIKKLGEDGTPMMGTCAGLILLSKEVYGGERSDLLGLLGVTIERNAYGRQRESFEAEICADSIGKAPFNAVFIRAPLIRGVDNGVKVLAEYDGRPVAVREKNILGLSFHPELSEDLRFQKLFLEMVESS